MNKDAVRSMVAHEARARGFTRKGTVYWRKAGDIVTLIQVQPHPWGKGVYINFGVNPSHLRTAVGPKRSTAWGVDERAECLRSRYRPLFDRMSTDNIVKVKQDDAARAIRWLFGWIDKHLSDSESVRSAILDMDPDSAVSPLGAITLAMKAWAKDPSH